VLLSLEMPSPYPVSSRAAIREVHIQKGIGEVPLIAAHAAVSCVVAHALSTDVKSYPTRSGKGACIEEHSWA